MNHNGVISLPLKTSEAIVMGQAVEVHNDSGVAQAKAVVTPANAIGVALQDVKETESGRPVDIQLFSAGGIVLMKTGGTIKSGPHAIVVGAAVKLDATGVTGNGGGGAAIGTALEPSSETGEFVRVVL